MIGPLSPAPFQARSPTARLSAESAASLLSVNEEEGLEVVVTPALARITVVAGLGGLLFGYDTGVVSGALLVIGRDFGGELLSTWQEEAIVSSALIGALIGSLAAGRLADWWGRKRVIILAAVLFSLGALEQAAATVYKELLLGRVVVGMGVGLASMVIPIYLAELSPAKFRGRLVGSLVILITLGQVLAYVVDAIFFSVPHGWRWMTGLGALPSLAQLLLSFSLPESPRYLILHNRIPPARATLKLIYPLSSETEIQRRIERIQSELLVDGDGVALVSEGGLAGVKEGLVQKLWRDHANRKALIVACTLQAAQQATGFNTLIYYSGRILESAHFSNPVVFALGIALSNFICTIIALRLIDHVGRRTLLLQTLLGMVLGMFLLGLAFLFIPSSDQSPADAGAWAYLALLSMIVFCCSYALGLGNVPWVVQSEIFTHELRAMGNGIATATNWTANLIVAATFLHLSKAITPSGAFWLYGAIAILAWLFTYFYLPETKGLDLEATRALFESGGWTREDVESGEGRGYAPVAGGIAEEEESGEEVERRTDNA